MLQLWVKLAGKICVNPKIRQKLYGNNIHLDIYKQTKLLKNKPQLQVIAYFFGSWCYNYEKACEWCQKQKLP